MKRAFAGALLVSALASATSCGNDEVSISLVELCGTALAAQQCAAQDRLAMRQQSAYVEFAVFQNSCVAGRCPNEAQLAVGDTSGAKFRAVVPAAGELPSVGDLDKTKEYAFAAVLRDENCGVLAYGCTCEKLEGIAEVVVSVAAYGNCDGELCCEACYTTMPSAGACPGECVNGSCSGGPGDGGVPDGGGDGSTDSGGDASPGGCSLTVVAAGELPAADGSRITGPSVAATDAGFVVAYRTQDTTSEELTARLLPIDDAGVAGSATANSLGVCPLTPEDGLGIGFADGAGLLVAGRPNCDMTGGAGADFMLFSADGTFTGGRTLSDPMFGELTLAQGHAIAPGAVTNEWEFVYRVLGGNGIQAQSGTLEGADFKSGTNISILFGAETAGFGMVARTGQVRALLGELPDQARTAFQIGVPDGPLADISDDGDAGASSLPQSSWGGIAAWNDRAAAVVKSTVGIRYQIADAAGNVLADKDLVGPTFRAGDVAVNGDNMIVVGAQTGGFTVYRLTGATGVPAEEPISTVTITGTAGGVSLSAFSGDRMGMAAARSRVAVAWVNDVSPPAGAPPGGWALLECAP